MNDPLNFWSTSGLDGEGFCAGTGRGPASPALCRIRKPGSWAAFSHKHTISQKSIISFCPTSFLMWQILFHLPILLLSFLILSSTQLFFFPRSSYGSEWRQNRYWRVKSGIKSINQQCGMASDNQDGCKQTLGQSWSSPSHLELTL